MVYRLLFVSSILMMLVASGNSQDTASRKKSEANVPSDAVITLERTHCYGLCPVYSLTVYGDGRVIFEGVEFVKRKGRAESKIDPARVADLVKAFETAGYFELDDEYVRKGCPQWWTDNPSATTSLTLNGHSKRIIHYHGCKGLDVLDKLTGLENLIDDTVNSRQWIGSTG